MMDSRSQQLPTYQNGNAAHHDDAESLASVDHPPSAHEGLPPSKIYHPLSLPVLALLIPASIFGVLARLGLEALATYDGQSIFVLAYPQSVGCLIMGFCLSLKEPIGRFYAPLYTALTTGFCGSVTTFSGWHLDVFNSWINAPRYDRAGLRDFVDGVAKLVFTLSLALGSVSFGSQLAALIAPHFPVIPPPNRIVRYSLTVLSILIYAAALPAYFRLPLDYRHQATAALLYAFPGTLLRYILSLRLNPLLTAMPLGTFTANAFGTALLAMFHVLQSRTPTPSINACAALQGLADGYCGCLTTVSTFAVEVRALKGWKSVRYVVVSCVAAQALMLLILGPSYWAGHISEQVACLKA